MLTYHVCPQLSNHRNPTKTANIFPPQAIAVAFAALEFSSTGPHDYLLHPFRPLLQRHLLMRHLLTMPVGCNGDIPFWILTFLFLFLKSYYFGYGCTPGIWKLPKLILTLLFFFSNLIIIIFFFWSWLHLRHVEVHRLLTESKLPLQTTTKFWQRQILDPLCRARGLNLCLRGNPSLYSQILN